MTDDDEATAGTPSPESQAARAYYEKAREQTADIGSWDDLDERTLETYRERIAAALAAAEPGGPMAANERQAVLAVVNLYGDDVLHRAFDAIGWPNDWAAGASESPTTGDLAMAPDITVDANGAIHHGALRIGDVYDEAARDVLRARLAALPAEVIDWPGGDDDEATTALIESVLRGHLPIESPEGWILCGGHPPCGTFEGPVFHRRHVADLVAAALAAAEGGEAAPADPEGMTAVPTTALRLLVGAKHGSNELEDAISELASVLDASELPPTAASTDTEGPTP